MSQPKRIQRKRTKGWKTPEDSVYVGRPSKWGNPLRIEGDMIYIDASYRRTVLSPWVYLCEGTIEEAVELYKLIVINRISRHNKHFRTPQDIEYWAHQFMNREPEHELAGKDLVCWCAPDQPCHADVLLKIANQHQA